MYNVLIADDNKQITLILSEYAKREGYYPSVAQDGLTAFNMFQKEKFDILLLDVMMPKMDGFELCKKVRESSNVPIIMITARGEDFERIMGLEIGADDYIVKPFSPSEIIARIKAIMRRVNRENSEAKQLSIGNLKLNIEDYSAYLNDKPLDLTKKEMEILWTLASNKGKVFSRENLLDSLWGYDYFGDSRTVDSHVKRLRAKLDEHDHPSWDIKTVWGVGYKLEVMDVEKE